MEKSAKWFYENFNGEIYYAVKANPSRHILQTLWNNSIRCFDVASLYEIELIYSMFPNAKLAFMHPVKNPNVISIAYNKYGVRQFVLDSFEELDKIIKNTTNNNSKSNDLILIVRICVDNFGSCLQLTNKFGCDGQLAIDLLKKTKKVAKYIGVSFHVGSQSIKPIVYSMALDKISQIIQKSQISIDIVDVGGGFPSVYNMEKSKSLDNYKHIIWGTLSKYKCFDNVIVWCEPGRGLVAESEGLLTRIEGIKNNCLYLNDGSFGALYDSVHENWNYPVRVIKSSGEILPITYTFDYKSNNNDFDLIPYIIYGPTCDSADKFPNSVLLPKIINEGDYLEWGNIGAYGRAMITNFNGFGFYQTVIVHDSPWISIFDLDTD